MNGFDQFIDEEYQMRLCGTIQNAIDDNIPMDQTNLTSFSKNFAIYLKIDMTTQISNEFKNWKRVMGGEILTHFMGRTGIAMDRQPYKRQTYQSIVWHEFNQKGIGGGVRLSLKGGTFQQKTAPEMC